MGFIIGVLLASIWPKLVLLLAPIILLVAAVCRSKHLFMIFFMVAGVIWVSAHWFVASEDVLPLSQGKTTQIVTGTVGAISYQPHKLDFDFQEDGSPYKLKVSCYRCPFKLQSADRWRFKLSIKPIYSFQNPNAFNYRKWMITKGYGAQGSVRIKASENTLLQRSNYGALDVLSGHLHALQFPILRALVLGDKSGIAGEDKRLIFSSGISHLFVVSGLHVGIVAGLVGLIMYWLQRPLLLLNWPYGRSVAVLAGLGVAMIYGAMAGFQVPAMRAVLMIMCAGVMLFQTRFTHVMHYYVFALLMVMLIKPLAFMDMGSWLSFGIVLALILGFAGSAKTSWFSGLLKAQWLAFGMGGIVLLGFNQALVPLSFLVNLLLIPIFTLLVMPLVLIAVSWALFFDSQGLNLLESLLANLMQVLHQVEPFITWSLPIAHEHRFLFMLALVLALLPKVLGLRALAGVMAVTVLVLPIKKPEVGGFDLIVFDVGQGSSALIETANHHVLVDTGALFFNGLGVVDFVLIPYFRQQRIPRLDMLHITHSDNDHAGGAVLLGERSNKVVTQSNCDALQWQYDGVTFERFQAKGYTKGNNGSCLLKVTARSGKSVLFTGDIEKEAEAQLIQQQTDLSSNVLIAPHHGSRTSSTAEFLDEVAADTVIVSAGFLNRYGHPHEQIISKYLDRNMMVYTTADKGSVQVAFPPRQEPLVVSTYRPNFGLIE
ncbi:MAG: DNA internalization-related competence protein ComEC/Rec2 [Bermanella sp.]